MHNDLLVLGVCFGPGLAVALFVVWYVENAHVGPFHAGIGALLAVADEAAILISLRRHAIKAKRSSVEKEPKNIHLVAGVSRLRTHNVNTGGHKTSLRLEPELWDGLAEVCRREGWTRNEAVAVARFAYRDRGATSAVRTYLMVYFQAAVG